METPDNFRQRINKAARGEDEGALSSIVSTGDNWLLGAMARDRGSVHSDIWRGRAAALASRGAIGIYPISGWWKEKHRVQRWDRPARYALLVSIRAPNADVDIYTPIDSQVGITVPAS